MRFITYKYVTDSPPTFFLQQLKFLFLSYHTTHSLANSLTQRRSQTHRHRHTHTLLSLSLSNWLSSFTKGVRLNPTLELNWALRCKNRVAMKCQRNIQRTIICFSDQEKILVRLCCTPFRSIDQFFPFDFQMPEHKTI